MATAFVTGGTGFIGRVVIAELVAAGHEVLALARSERTAADVTSLGAAAVSGDLIMSGRWQAAAARADWLVHLAEPRTFPGRVTPARAEAYAVRRLVMDRHLLFAAAPSVRKVVYVAPASYYGDLGPQLRDEDAAPHPRGWGRFVAPAVTVLDRHLRRGVPLVCAFPGWVYGDGSWFRERVMAPLKARRRLLMLTGREHRISTVHVEDCARALVHLCEKGEPGRRYFVADDRPTSIREVQERAAAALSVPLSIRKVPRFVARLLIGPVAVEALESDTALSNHRLRALGWAPKYPTIDEGIPQVVANARW